MAVEAPEGASLKILSEFPGTLPGIEKVQVQELRLEPGAKWENFVVASTALCTVVKGQVTAMHNGHSAVYSRGSRMVLQKGTTQSFYNTSVEPHVQHIWMLIPTAETFNEEASAVTPSRVVIDYSEP